MTHYEQRLSEDTDRLMRQITDLAERVQQGLNDSVRALETGDQELAYATILRDGPINRLTEAVESDAHRFIAKHLPSGGHLRFVSSAMRIAILLERMGDYAVTISRHSATLQTPLTGTFKREVSSMAADALQMFKQAMEAFTKRDASLARGTIGYAEQVDRDFINALAMLTDEGTANMPVEDLFARLVIIRQLERVSDQAKNLCEETVFALTGETKVRKPMPILVVAKKDNARSKIVCAVAKRLYSDKVAVTTAGAEPASEVRDDVRSFLTNRGFQPPSNPQTLAQLAEPISAFKVVVTLDEAAAQAVGRLPYGVAGQAWALDANVSVEDAYRSMAAHLGELVDLVRGL